MIIGNTVMQPAVFFELDGVVRQLKREVAQDYQSRGKTIPPVPVKPGQQRLVDPVVAFIRGKCLETGAIPIALDMAPYLGVAVPDDLPADQRPPDFPMYERLWAELKRLLQEQGLPEPRLVYCNHPAHPIDHRDKAGNVVRTEFLPRCKCRFPQPGLILAACQAHGVSHYFDEGALQVFAPSLMIGNSHESREAAIIGASMSYAWVEGILNGSIHLADQVTHAHLKNAALLKDAERGIRSDIEAGRPVERQVDLVPMPGHLDAPSKVTRDVRFVNDVDAQG